MSRGCAPCVNGWCLPRLQLRESIHNDEGARRCSFPVSKLPGTLGDIASPMYLSSWELKRSLARFSGVSRRHNLGRARFVLAGPMAIWGPRSYILQKIQNLSDKRSLWGPKKMIKVKLESWRTKLGRNSFSSYGSPAGLIFCGWFIMLFLSDLHVIWFSKHPQATPNTSWSKVEAMSLVMVQHVLQQACLSSAQKNTTAYKHMLPYMEIVFGLILLGT